MEQKKKNESEGQSDLDYIILPKTHSSMYLMHKYWARKPANVVSSYIRKYCPRNGVVLDPFMGSGVTILESIFQGRKAIGVDINPSSKFICENSGIITDILHLKKGFDWIKNKIESDSSSYTQFFNLNCPICSHSALITHVIWKNSILEENQDIIDEIRIKCPKCKDLIYSEAINPSIFHRLKLKILDLELKAAHTINTGQINIPHFQLQYSPENKFIQLRHNMRNTTPIRQLFTNRNLYFLSSFYSLLENLPPEFADLQQLFKFAFTAALGQASKMVWVIDKRKGKKLAKRQVGSWTHHFFWDPSSYFEVNAWFCIKERFNKLLKGKIDSNSRNNKSPLKFNPASSYSSFSEKNPVLLLSQSSHSLQLPDNSIDFIFTDPPYGDSIQYGELSSLWNAWLGFDMEQHINTLQSHEIVINSHQGKKLNEYSEKLRLVFKEMFRLLKSGHFMVITFHNTSLSIRNGLITAILQSGFDLKQVLFQLPPRVSLKSMLHHKGSPIGDYFIRFQKPNQNPSHDSKEILYSNRSSNMTSKEIISKLTSMIVRILKCRGEPTSFLWISNFLDEFLFQEKMFPLINCEFYINRISASSIFIIDENEKWWFSDSEKELECEPPLSLKIRTFLLQNASRFQNTIQNSKFKQAIFNEVYRAYRGVYTPDKFTINQIIEEIFLK